MRPSLRSLTTFVLLGTMAAVPAFAQSSAVDPSVGSQYAACTGKPSSADTEAAHGAYMAGKGSFDEADYTTAISYFKDAYRRDCTKHELLVIIARAYELQGNRREAVHALETYLERVPAAADAEVQKRHIANLKREITEQPAASASASASASAVPPPPAASASSPPADSARVIPASPPPPVVSSRHHTAGPWVLVIAGGVATIAGAALYGAGASQVSSAEEVCGSAHLCPPGSSAISQGNSGRSLESVGVPVGIVGLAAVVAGIIWHFAEPTRADGPKTARPSLSPQVGPGYAGAGLSGAF